MVENEMAKPLIQPVPEPELEAQQDAEPDRERFASVCILSYERPQFLRECITSVIETADYPFELIVHDDGSKDESLRALLQELTDNGIISTLISNPPGWNQGQGIALNRMFHMAKGDPIVKMDQDMLFEQGWLRRSAEILEHNRRQHYFEDQEPAMPRIGALGLFKYSAAPVRHEEMFLHRHGDWDQVRDFVGSVMVIPRDSWQRFGPFEERSVAFAEDNTFKMHISGSAVNNPSFSWACGLTHDDLAVNRGFGVGPSTVVIDHGRVQPIKQGPKLLAPR
jgi:glycosyltransferase involved in cell wall biosynthesis